MSNPLRRLVRFGQRLIGPGNLAAEALLTYGGTPINSDEYVARELATRDTRFLKELLRSQGHASTSIARHTRRIRKEELKHYRQIIDDYRRAHPCPRFDNLGFEFADIGTPNAVAVHVKSDNSFAIGMDPRLHAVGAWLIDLAYITYRQNVPEDFIHMVAHSVQTAFLGAPLSEEHNAFYLQVIAHTEANPPVWRDWLGLMVGQFLVGHELGHIYLDHFATGKATLLRLNPQADRDDEISAFAHQQEYAADAWAATSLKGRGTGSVVFNLTARAIPAILFSVFAVIEELHEPKGTMAAALRKSHPRASERAERLRKIGAPASDLKMPLRDLEALFQLADYIDEARRSPAFQQLRSQFRELSQKLARDPLEAD